MAHRAAIAPAAVRHQIPPMPDYSTLILLMIVGDALYGWWPSARAAAERAATLGRDACQAAGVIWLDQSVHANGLKLRRGEDGRLGLERSFRFEYSEDGIQRHIGKLVLFRDELVYFSGPVRGASVVPLH